MKNLTKKDQEVLADYISKYGKIKMLLAELRAEVLETGEQAQSQFEKLHGEKDFILMDLERDFGIEVEGLAEAKQRQEDFDKEFFGNLI